MEKFVAPRLTPLQEKDLDFEVDNHGLTAESFEWKDQPSRTKNGRIVPALVHRQTGWYFIFDYPTTDRIKKNFKFLSIRSPGMKNSEDNREDQDWDAVRDFFWDWIDLIKKNLKISNLWNTVNKEKNQLQNALVINGENTSIQQEEFNAISTKLIDIKKGLEEQVNELLKNQETLNNRLDQNAEFFNQQFELLINSARKLGRKDWLLLVYNTFISISVSAGFNDASREAIFRFLIAGFHWLIEILRHLPK